MRRILIAVVLAIVATVMAGCAASPPPVSERVQKYYDENVASKPSAAPTAQPVTFTAVGDSVTEGDSPDFNGGKTGALSWVSHMPAGTKFVGGWAKHGSTTDAMTAGVKAQPAEVLVMMAGTNDVLAGVPFGKSAANLIAIVKTVGAKRVLISAIPPLDSDPAAATAYNTKLQALSAQQGWAFVDSMAGVRKGDTYAPGMTTDGVHPTLPGVNAISAVLAKAVKG
ncbi:SGNH/GDSL hydrolase family protein [Pseudarthrobacter sp. B907]|uniref:SGNH/GDSL hydrolase family protein n=1 Tax=Pseudarthrobacter sp. B907 TaxID=3158261 RepID=UPI0032DA177C